jgi:peptide-methionine (S)-S-oxide reductase
MKLNATRVAATFAILAAGIMSSTRAASAATVHAAKPDSVVFAGGCFWGIQAVFQHTKGVLSATSGYAGGTVDRPTYEQVSS